MGEPELVCGYRAAHQIALHSVTTDLVDERQLGFGLHTLNHYFQFERHPKVHSSPEHGPRVLETTAVRVDEEPVDLQLVERVDAQPLER